MKNILVLMHDDRGQESRLQSALDLARAVDGHLTCVDVTFLYPGMGDYTGYSQVMLAEERAREARNRSVIEARLADEEVPYDWIDVTGDFAEGLGRAAGLADVIVVNRQLDGVHFPDMLGTAGELLVKVKRPVLAVPQDAHGFDAFGEALVAWDGSREASAALRAAMPLLEKAGRVMIVEIDDGSIRAPATEAAEYCSRHGVKPVVHQLPAQGEPASAMLLAAVGELGASYVVMGGFGRTRLAERLFGGVTRRMLSDSPVPIFLAHE